MMKLTSEKVVEMVKERYPNMDVEELEVEKINGMKHGIVVKNENQDATMGMCIYLEDVSSIEDIFNIIENERDADKKAYMVSATEFAKSIFSDKEKFLEMVYPRLLSQKLNPNFTPSVPVLGDLIVTFALHINQELSVRITDEHLRCLNISIGEVHEKAMKNLEKEVKVFPLHSMISTLINDPEVRCVLESEDNQLFNMGAGKNVTVVAFSFAFSTSNSHKFTY